MLGMMSSLRMFLVEIETSCTLEGKKINDPRGLNKCSGCCRCPDGIKRYIEKTGNIYDNETETAKRICTIKFKLKKKCIYK
ncbi:hypothetical protein QTP88_007013 [Uroleucon formosanum]